MKFNAERKLIEQTIDCNVLELLERYDTILAGGALTSVFTNTDINDLDIYFKNQRDLVAILYEIFLGDFPLVVTNMTNRSIMLHDPTTKQDVQFITLGYFENPTDIFDSFDFTCNMGAYSFKTKEFTLHEDFFRHNAQRYLKFNEGTLYPIMSMLRTNKYIDRGYNISKPEFLRIIFKCMDLEIHDWDTLIDHISGMYGYDMTDLFDQEKEYSIQSAMEQLDNLHDRDIKRIEKPIIDDFRFEKIINALDIVEFPELKFDDPCFDGKYYYKCVNAKWESPMISDGRITYDLDSIVNGGKNGIYCHKDVSEPCHSSSYWIELEPVGEVEKKTDKWGYRKEIQIIGDLKVRRQFKYLAEPKTEDIIFDLYPELEDLD